MRKGSLLLLNGQGPIAFHRKAVLDCVTNDDISRVGRIGVDVCTVQCLRVLSNTCFPAKSTKVRDLRKESIHSASVLALFCHPLLANHTSNSQIIERRFWPGSSIGTFCRALANSDCFGWLFRKRASHHEFIHCSSYIIILSLISQVLSSILYRCAAKADWRFCGGER